MERTLMVGVTPKYYVAAVSYSVLVEQFQNACESFTQSSGFKTP